MTPVLNVLEKVERLKTILTSHAESKSQEGYEAAYRELRRNLLDNPKVRPNLPSFVRTCESLSEFWAFIKSNDLPTYNSRRKFIREKFAPLILTLQDQAPGEGEAFFPKGSNHDAYTHIRSILQTAQTDVFIIDPYLDSSIYFVLGTLSSPRVAVKFLTANPPLDFALEGRKFVLQHPAFQLETRRTRDFHDRFIVLDQKKCYLLGASIKDAGNRGCAIVPLEAPEIVDSILDYANKVWESATPI